MAEDIKGEEAIRLYLQFLQDPETLRDEAVVTRAEAQVEKAKDPIDRLRAIADLERARAVDGERFEADFIREARAWADRERVPLIAFQKMDVRDDILIAAGFSLPRRGRTKGVSTKSARSPRVSIETVKSNVPTQGTFTLVDVANRSGGSAATIRKAVEDLVQSGDIENLGPAKDYKGRGRAPILYQAKG